MTLRSRLGAPGWRPRTALRREEAPARGRGTPPRARAAPAPPPPEAPRPPRACRPRAWGAPEAPAGRYPLPQRRRRRAQPLQPRAPRAAPPAPPPHAPGPRAPLIGGPLGQRVGGGCGRAGPRCLRRGRLPLGRRRCAPASCPLPGSCCSCGSGGRAPRRCGSDPAPRTIRAPVSQLADSQSARRAAAGAPGVLRRGGLSPAAIDDPGHGPAPAWPPRVSTVPSPQAALRHRPPYVAATLGVGVWRCLSCPPTPRARPEPGSRAWPARRGGGARGWGR